MNQSQQPDAKTIVIVEQQPDAKTIVIVEDDDSFFKLMEINLKSKAEKRNVKIEIIRFSAFNPAYRKLEEIHDSVSVISTDMGYPRYADGSYMNKFIGITLINVLTEYEIKTPVVIYSGNRKIDVIDELKKSGSDFPHDRIFDKSYDSDKWAQTILDLVSK